MKTTFFFLKNLPISTTAHNVFRSYFTPLIFAILTLSSCSSDDDNFSAADAAKIVGTYSVTDTDEDGDVETYFITISQSKDGGIEISNFGDIMYVPVKATIKGNAFNVPAQTFKGKSMTIVITGNGTLNDTNLNFNYSIDTGDGIILEHSCVASKSV